MSSKISKSSGVVTIVASFSVAFFVALFIDGSSSSANKLFLDLLWLTFLFSALALLLRYFPQIISFLGVKTWAATVYAWRRVSKGEWTFSIFFSLCSRAFSWSKSRFDLLWQSLRWEHVKASIGVMLIVATMGFGVYSIYTVVSFVSAIPDKISAAAERGRQKGNSKICRNGYWLNNDYSSRCATKEEKKVNDWLLNDVFFQ